MDFIKGAQELWHFLTPSAPPPPPPQDLGVTGLAKWQAANLREDTPHQGIKDRLESTWERSQTYEPSPGYAIESDGKGGYKAIGLGQPYQRPRLHPPGQVVGGNGRQ